MAMSPLCLSSILTSMLSPMLDHFGSSARNHFILLLPNPNIPYLAYHLLGKRKEKSSGCCVSSAQDSDIQHVSLLRR